MSRSSSLPPPLLFLLLLLFLSCFSQDPLNLEGGRLKNEIAIHRRAEGEIVLAVRKILQDAGNRPRRNKGSMDRSISSCCSSNETAPESSLLRPDRLISTKKKEEKKRKTERWKEREERDEVMSLQRTVPP